MRLLLLTAAVAVLAATSTAIEIQTADVAPLLTAIPGVAEFENVADIVGLPGLLEVLPATLISPETSWDKVRAILAGTGVAIIEIAAFIGYIFHYIDKITETNLEIREANEAAEAAAEAAEAEAAEAEEAAAEGQERYIIVPFKSGASKNPVIDPRPNIRRLYQPPAIHPQYTKYPPYRHPRPQILPYRRQKREEAPSTPSPQGSVAGDVYEAGKHIMWVLKRVFLKEAQKETAAKEIAKVIDALKEDMMHRLDEDGCLQKIVCHLQEKPKERLTKEEETMQVFFPTSQHETCTPERFPRCLLSADELDDMLIATPKTTLNILP